MQAPIGGAGLGLRPQRVMVGVRRVNARADMIGKENLAGRVNIVLAGLVLFDAALTLWAFLAPTLWFQLFHGVPYSDPEGFLRRCGANWAAFALFQAVAFLRWRANPSWIAVVAGIRLSDIFTDWTYLAFASHVTTFGFIGLAAMSPINLLLGCWLLRAQKELR